MKTLTIRQPWASLICFGEKDIENRSWNTEYRGRILVHAAKKIDKTGMNVDYLPTGSIIGAIEIVDVIKSSSSKWAEPGCYHWVLKNPILFRRPIPCLGQLSFWNYPLDENFILQI